MILCIGFFVVITLQRIGDALRVWAAAQHSSSELGSAFALHHPCNRIWPICESIHNFQTNKKQAKRNERKNKKPLASLAFPEAEEPRAMVVGVHHRSHLCALSVHRVILHHPEAMKKRLTAEQWQQEFRQLLNETIVTFHYRKKDRTLRKATGTTCLDLIPTDSLPKGIGAPAPKGQVRYYDFTVGGWRTARLAHVTSYYETSPDPS